MAVDRENSHKAIYVWDRFIGTLGHCPSWLPTQYRTGLESSTILSSRGSLEVMLITCREWNDWSKYDQSSGGAKVNNCTQSSEHNKKSSKREKSTSNGQSRMGLMLFLSAGNPGPANSSLKRSGHKYQFLRRWVRSSIKAHPNYYTKKVPKW